MGYSLFINLNSIAMQSESTEILKSDTFADMKNILIAYYLTSK